MYLNTLSLHLLFYYRLTSILYIDENYVFFVTFVSLTTHTFIKFNDSMVQ